MTFSLSVEVGGIRIKKFGVWLPDGLHLWLGSRGVHIFWSGPSPRINFDRLEQP